MSSLRMLKDHEGHKSGSVVSMPFFKAKQWIAAGVAEYPAAELPKPAAVLPALPAKEAAKPAKHEPPPHPGEPPPLPHPPESHKPEGKPSGKTK